MDAEKAKLVKETLLKDLQRCVDNHALGIAPDLVFGLNIDEAIVCLEALKETK